MISLEQLMKEKEVNFEELLNFGFVKKGENYIFNKELADGSVKLIIQITTDYRVGTKIIDSESKETYELFYNLDCNGAFVSLIRNEYDLIMMKLANKCFCDKNRLPGQTSSGDMMLFSSQMEALEAELVKLNGIIADNGILSEYEEERKREIEEILEKAEVALDPINTDKISYGTSFAASIDGRSERKFTLVYANTAILKSTTGFTFLAQDSIFGMAVLGKRAKEKFEFINQRGIESCCEITEIFDEPEEYNPASHGCKVR